MERDNDLPLGSTAGQGTTGTGGATGGTTGSEIGGEMGGAAGTTGAGFRDRARDLAGNAQERLADIGSTVREKTATAKDSLADALESGAQRLRQRTTGGEMAGATGTTNIPLEDGRAAQMTNKLATGMDATADWLREADLDSMRAAVERQVREHPGRTLLIAAGVGYLIGKAFKSNR